MGNEKRIRDSCHNFIQWNVSNEKEGMCLLTHTLFTLLYMYLLETTKIFYRLLHIGCKGAMGQQEPFPTSC